jgi:uncharacterized protein (DUF1800 family)
MLRREFISTTAWKRRLASALVALVSEACGGGGGGGLVPGPDPPASEAQAARFLTRSTFGPSHEDIHKLSVIGYTAWFDEQTRAATTVLRPTLEAWKNAGADVGQDDRLMLWWRNVVQRPDQLRQRMAFSLGEIFVISDVAGTLRDDPVGMGEYYDILARGAFGNYRTLLEQITKSPAMGKYLSMLKNQKADPANNIRPDENYAREIMQLFSIGLNELNPDGTEVLDGSGNPIPTYDQSVVEGFAATFTGWNYANATSWDWPDENYLPMEPWESYHETAAKTVLDGNVISAGQTAQQDLTMALDIIFNHPNVGPFMAHALIQRLVTSNPSPAYVGRVAAVFADDGTGVRGNLLAVLKAILLDPDAVNGPTNDPATFGKLREPLLRLTALWRAFHAVAPGGYIRYSDPEEDFAEAPGRAPSVFNFFAPDYLPPGALHDAGIFAPEFQITTEAKITTTTNRFYGCTFDGWYGGTHDLDKGWIVLNTELPLAADPVALVEDLNLLLMSGQMSPEMKTIVESMVTDTDPADPRQRVLEALYLITTSPEFSVQK